MSSCYICKNQAEEDCSECGQPFCSEHKALKVGSLCVQCDIKETNKYYRFLVITFLLAIVILPFAILIMELL